MEIICFTRSFFQTSKFLEIKFFTWNLLKQSLAFP